MDGCRTVARLLLWSTFLGLACSASINAASTEPNSLNIVEDVITDVENSTQKVIRVNPLDLPPIVPDDEDTSDSSLYNIQNLLPPPTYVSSQKFRKQKNIPKIDDSPIIREFSELKLKKSKRPKQKQLHMLYNQSGFNGKGIQKRMKVRVAPGAYPIYYVLVKSNGEFHKQPIKGFRNEQEMDKYFVKVNKIGKLNAIDHS